MADVTINYKDAAIATMDASGTKTLQTQGKYCEDDITIAYVKPGGGGGSQQVEADLIARTLSGAYSNDLVTSVGTMGFSRCPLTSVSLPNCTFLGDSAFRYCSQLTSVHVPKADSNASSNYNFGGMTSLTVIALPSFTGLRKLPLAFQNDTALTTVDLGERLESFTNQTFSGCTNFNTLILRRSAAITEINNTNVFNGTKFASGGSGGTIYIPKALYDHLGDGTALDYKASTSWSTVDGYGTITWATIEGSIYENAYADGTPIT